MTEEAGDNHPKLSHSRVINGKSEVPYESQCLAGNAVRISRNNPSRSGHVLLSEKTVMCGKALYSHLMTDYEENGRKRRGKMPRDIFTTIHHHTAIRLS